MSERDGQHHGPPRGGRRAAAERLYRSLDWAVVRAPLLPVEDYCALVAGRHPSLRTWARDDHRIRQALTVGSGELVRALDGDRSAKREARAESAVLRYVIRMATRPTPYGLFAGVALAHWSTRTTLELGRGSRARMRPDMGWLWTLVTALEADPQIRRHLRWVRNPASWIHHDRVLLAERAPTADGAGWGPPVSLRATAAVRTVLAAAQSPTAHQALVRELLALPGATPEKAQAVVDELADQTILLSELRPPLATASPAHHVADILARVPPSAELAEQLRNLLHAMAAWSDHTTDGDDSAYLRLVQLAEQVHPSPHGPPVQVDLALGLTASGISHSVSTDAARAAELLLRMSPVTGVPVYLDDYRRSFETRYGANAEVPLLEVLDPTVGLGPPIGHSHGGRETDELDRRARTLRQQTLRELALAALRDGRTVVELDDATVARLATWSPRRDMAPPSLELSVFVVSRSRCAIDTGDYLMVIGPNLGSLSAGRGLGRFADILGHEARTALIGAAQAESAHTPGALWAEVTYIPHMPRSANVAVRPAVREFEIALGTSPGAHGGRVIPLEELSVFVREGRLRVFWRAHAAEVIPCAGHMLNTAQAPALARFLEDVGRSAAADIRSFDWGPAGGLPFLPRVQHGRLVLAPAQWRIDERTRDDELAPEPLAFFAERLGAWRERWDVPRFVYLTVGDNRLLLDLNDAAQVAELRTELHQLEDSVVVLHEALPGPSDVWTPGPDGHYMTELVVPLVLSGAPSRTAYADTVATLSHSVTDEPGSRLRPPGSEWLYLKLYSTPGTAETLVAGPLRAFGDSARNAGLAEGWFFIRYADPDEHVRVRFRGYPDDLRHRLLPELTSWAGSLMNTGLCQHFSVDTYEREIRRYGGPAATAAAESLFMADSRAVADILALQLEGGIVLDRTTVGVLSIDDLLEGLGLDELARLAWYRSQTLLSPRDGEYRRRQRDLRQFLGDTAAVAATAGGQDLLRIFAERRAELRAVSQRLERLALDGQLTQPPSVLYRSYIHLHCNRILDPAGAPELQLIDMLRRVREGLARAPLAPTLLRLMR